MFRAFKCSSSGDSIVQYHIGYMSLYVGLDGTPFRPNLHRLTYTRYGIDTIEFPYDEHLNDRKM